MDRQCVQCGDTFKARNDEHAFCSEPCRRAARGSDYRKARELALRRDNYTCTDCDSDDHLECHHKQPVSRGGGHELSNLQTLCRKCHKQVHREWRLNGYTGPGQGSEQETESKGSKGSESYDHAA